MNLHNQRELNDLLDLNAVKHRTRFPNGIINSSTRHPLPMLCPSGPSEAIYPGANKDYWSNCPPSSSYDDGIYDGNYSNRDILHPFITNEPLNSRSINATSRTATNDLTYSEKLDEKTRRSVNALGIIVKRLLK